MDKEYTSVEEQVEYGLDAVDKERIVEVPLQDLLYVYKTLAEFVSFFHQPLHYPDLESVEKFIGSDEEGAFHLLHECYYKKLRDVWPQDVQTALEEVDFDHPNPPYYHRPTSE